MLPAGSGSLSASLGAPATTAGGNPVAVTMACPSSSVVSSRRTARRPAAMPRIAAISAGAALSAARGLEGADGLAGGLDGDAPVLHHLALRGDALALGDFA